MQPYFVVTALTKVKPRQAGRGRGRGAATHSSGWPDSSGLAVFPHCLMLLLTLLAAACSLGCATAAVWEV